MFVHRGRPNFQIFFWFSHHAHTLQAVPSGRGAAAVVQAVRLLRRQVSTDLQPACLPASLPACLLQHAPMALPVWVCIVGFVWVVLSWPDGGSRIDCQVTGRQLYCRLSGSL